MKPLEIDWKREEELQEERLKNGDIEAEIQRMEEQNDILMARMVLLNRLVDTFHEADSLAGEEIIISAWARFKQDKNKEVFV